MPPRKRASARPPEPPKDNESANRKRKIEEVTVISSEEDESAVKAETEQKTAKPRVRRRRVETDDDGYESSSSSNSELDEDIEFEEDKNVDVKNESDDLVENSELASTTPKKAGTKTPVKRTPPSRNASERAAAGLRRTMEVLAALGAESTTSEEDAPAPVSKTKAAASAAKGKTAPSKAQTAQPKPPKEPKAPQKRSAASASARKSAPPAPKSTKKPASDSSSESDFALKRETGGSSSSSSTSSSGSESDTGSSLSSTEEPALNPDAPRRRPRAPVDPVERQKKLEQARKKRESTIKLKVEKHHPELQQVWNSVDLTTNYDRAKKPTQEGIEQPAELVLRLLPFQLEGVGWMRRQEDSEFGGGILADEMGLGMFPSFIHAA